MQVRGGFFAVCAAQNDTRIDGSPARGVQCKCAGFFAVYAAQNDTLTERSTRESCGPSASEKRAAPAHGAIHFSWRSR